MAKDENSSDEEEVWQLAQRKYEVFEEQCKDLLDPELISEFEAMKRMGLPTKLINRYEDLEEVSN